MPSSQQQHHQSPSAPTTWNEPPWTGWIETTGDALLILEAARRGLIPRVTRRLVDSERKMITSGSVFVFDEDESGIKRWTDGFFWSPSRILGNFLLYRETDKRGPGHKAGGGGGGARASGDSGDDGESTSLSRPKSEAGTSQGLDKLRERSLMGSLTNSYKFKSDGLMKKTFSLNIGGVAQHLISYYRIEDVENGRLRSPSSLPELASLDISPVFLDKTHFRNPPKVEMGPDGVLRYRGEADEVDSSTTVLGAPLPTGPPLLTDGRITDPKRSTTRRYEPYSTMGSPTSSSASSSSAVPPSAGKRSRKRNDKSPDSPSSPGEDGRSSSQTPTPTSATLPPLPSLVFGDQAPVSGVGAGSGMGVVQQPQHGYTTATTPYYHHPHQHHPMHGYGPPPQHMGMSMSMYPPPYHPQGVGIVGAPNSSGTSYAVAPGLSLGLGSTTAYVGTPSGSGSGPANMGPPPPSYYGYYHHPSAYGYAPTWTASYAAPGPGPGHGHGHGYPTPTMPLLPPPLSTSASQSSGHSSVSPTGTATSGTGTQLSGPGMSGGEKDADGDGEGEGESA